MGNLSSALRESNKPHWSQLTTASMRFIKDWVSIGKLISAPSLVKFPPAFWSDNLYLIFKEKFTLLSLFWGQFLFWTWIEIDPSISLKRGKEIKSFHFFWLFIGNDTMLQAMPLSNLNVNEETNYSGVSSLIHLLFSG